ncbi:mersacidin family lantibiotic [Priestia megaterium]|uniref:mersacidin family lantibiotic n=1 Tax=Priestia megaterium TaxID=1404 RepID=UPI0025704428|nr:mersacidin family lantibiotic [Priestia megaterium]WJD83658.1 mersacidin family lantibiotic [Priestia megaterium]
MTNNQLIEAWKNPELRANLDIQHPSGQAFAELSIDEMLNIQGAGDVQPETTPATSTVTSTAFCLVTTVPVGVTISLKWC